MKRYQCGDLGGSTSRPCQPQHCCFSQHWGCSPVPCVEGEVYCAGQIVSFQGSLYQVRVNRPCGVPGCSDDFKPIDDCRCEPCCGPTGPTGPRGLTGPTGPTGPMGPTGSTERKKDAQPKVAKSRKQGYFGALLMQSIPYNILTSPCAFFGGGF